MKKNVIITGATGMVGKGVLLECLDHENIGSVLTIGRSHVDMEHPKLKQLMVNDFNDLADVALQLMGYDACYFCLGVSARGMKEAQYHEITYNYTLSLAKTLYSIDKTMTFIYVSGESTDSSEKGRMMWARVKGKTENDLIKMGFHQAFMFRPGAIIPLRGIKSRTAMYQFMYDYFMWLVHLIKFFAPNSVVNTTQLGLAMINATFKGYDKSVIRPRDILILANNS